MTKSLALAALACALALPAAAAISPETFTKADRLDAPALQKGDMLPVNGDIEDGAIVIGYQTGTDSITLFRVPLMTVAAR